MRLKSGKKRIGITIFILIMTVFAFNMNITVWASSLDELDADSPITESELEGVDVDSPATEPESEGVDVDSPITETDLSKLDVVSLIMEPGVRAAEDIVVFGDPLIKRAVNKSLKVADLDADVTEAQIATVGTLYLEEAGTIKSFDGLQYAVGLRSISIGKSVDATSETSEIKLGTKDFSPLYGLTRLYQLNLYTGETEFTSLEEISQLSTGLTSLLVNVSNIDDLTALKSMTNITDLKLSGAKTKTVSFDPTLIYNLNLTNLSLRHMEFTKELDFSAFDKLYILAVNYTNLSDISTLPVTAPIINVNFNDNPELKDVSHLGEFKTITGINVSNTGISDISFLKTMNMSKMAGIYLYNNEIVDISPLAGLSIPTMFSIDLSGNKIEDISAFETMTLRNGVFINIRSNRIKDITPLTQFTETSGRVNATNQVLELPEVELGTGTLLDFKDYDGGELLYYDLNELNETSGEYGTFVIEDGVLTWDEITPEDNLPYNRFVISNYELGTPSPIQPGKIVYSASVIQSVIPVTDQGGTETVKPEGSDGNEDTNNEVVKTGDKSHIEYYILLLVISLIVGTVLFVRRKKI